MGVVLTIRAASELATFAGQPGGAKVAGAKLAGVVARIMRGRTDAGRSVFFNPRTKQSGWEGGSHPENTAHGLRDFSPGASVISAMRPPFSATQEFFVSGYLSV
jgi:hypothetical protein